jgi:metal-dependent HD superfamily phosphatase/phosphodiesterase
MEVAMVLELTSEEQELLTVLLEERQRALLHEIGRAEHRDFRATLLAKELILETLLTKLAVAEPVGK